MRPVSQITLADHKMDKQAARETIAKDYDLCVRADGYENLLKLLKSTPVGALDRKVKHGENLTFEESFCGTCNVLAATNKRFYDAYLPYFTEAYGTFSWEKSLAIASAFLNLMATKESLSDLTPEEIAGMAAAGTLDTLMAVRMEQVVETCGMGGDRGFPLKGKTAKSINLSTLSSLVLAGLGLPAVKHGSYGNTSALGSTDAIENFGAIAAMTSEAQVMDIISRSGYCFFDAHWCKTIHDLSHLLMMETVNHVIGPMTSPIHSDSLMFKVMGVNEKVHPELVAKAYAILHERRMRNMGSAVIVAGLDIRKRDIKSPLDYKLVRAHTVLDEVSPYASIVAISIGSEYRGSYVIQPEDFGVTIDPRNILIENTRDTVIKANIGALRGEHRHLADYLAVNSALGLFAFEYASRPNAMTSKELNKRYLHECYQRCRAFIATGDAYRTLTNYVSASGGKLVVPERW